MEELKEFLAKLKQTDKLVIVEGVKDKKALEELEVKNIITLSKKPIFQIIEEISKNHDEIIILTDFDKKGKELYRRLREGLKKQGVKIDTYFREFLLKTKLSHIEGLATYINNNH